MCLPESPLSCLRGGLRQCSRTRTDFLATLTLLSCTWGRGWSLAPKLSLDRDCGLAFSPDLFLPKIQTASAPCL